MWFLVINYSDKPMRICASDLRLYKLSTINRQFFYKKETFWNQAIQAYQTQRFSMIMLTALSASGINLNSLIEERKAKKLDALVYKDLGVWNRICHKIYIYGNAQNRWLQSFPSLIKITFWILFKMWIRFSFVCLNKQNGRIFNNAEKIRINGNFYIQLLE